MKYRENESVIKQAWACFLHLKSFESGWIYYIQV